MWLSPVYFNFLRSVSVVILVLCAALPAQAQDSPTQSAGQNVPAAPPKKPPKPYGGGSPLDVLLHTKLWETPPPVKSFVKESREPSRDLHYQRTIGTDPKRPKLLSHDQLKTMQDELEYAGARNEKAAGVKDKNFADVDLSKGAKLKSGKGKAVKAKANKAKMPAVLHAQ